jgi:protein SCO1/2
LKINFKVILIGTVALATGVYLQLFGFNPPVRSVSVEGPEIQGFFWPKQKALSEFELVSQHNKPFTLNDMKKDWNFVFFGYTHCPDICPITMNTMREVREKLTSQSTKDYTSIKFSFVSVDGKRDTPEILDAYVNYFGEGFQGATGSKTQVDSLVAQLGVPYTIDEHEPGNETYLVGHSAAIFLISPAGKLAAIFQAPHSATEIFDKFIRIDSFMQKSA